MNLKQWNNKWILYVSDVWSRLTVAKFIKRKKRQEDFNATMTRSSHPEVFLRKGALKICNKCTGEQPCRSVISIK